MDVAAKIEPRHATTGNDYWIGFWFYGVPTLFEYSASMSPAFFRAVTPMLARPNDLQARNVIVLLRPDAHALGIFGVRFIISNTELTDPFRLVMTEHTHKDEVLFLYEVPEVNLGTVAPTEVEVAKGFDEAVDRLTNLAFDAKHSVIVCDSTIADKRLV
jgi:hypothetical protein